MLPFDYFDFRQHSCAPQLVEILLRYFNPDQALIFQQDYPEILEQASILRCFELRYSIPGGPFDDFPSLLCAYDCVRLTIRSYQDKKVSKKRVFLKAVWNKKSEVLMAGLIRYSHSIPNKHKTEAVHKALHVRDDELLKFLLQQGCKFGGRALFCVIKQGRFELFKFLMQHPNFDWEARALKGGCKDSMHLAIQACDYKQIEILAWLCLESGQELKDSYSWVGLKRQKEILLSFAVRQGHLLLTRDIVRRFYPEGLEQDSSTVQLLVNKALRCPNNLKVLAYLQSKGGTLDENHLLTVAASGDLEQLNWYLAQYPVGDYGRQYEACIRAAAKGHIDILDRLLEFNPDTRYDMVDDILEYISELDDDRMPFRLREDVKDFLCYHDIHCDY